MANNITGNGGSFGGGGASGSWQPSKTTGGASGSWTNGPGTPAKGAPAPGTPAPGTTSTPNTGNSNPATVTPQTTLKFLPNLLDNYDVYTYHWKLFITSLENASAGTIFNLANQIVIAESGVSD